MKKLSLNFSTHHIAWSNVFSTLCLMLLLAILAVMLNKQQSITEKIQTLESANQHPALKTQKRKPLSEVELREQKIATTALQSLNIPWQALFDTLERAQSDHQDIYLYSIQPNPLRNEVIISGSARNFASMMAYVETLKKQASVQEVSLVNQAWVQEGGNKTLEFTLNVGWKF